MKKNITFLFVAAAVLALTSFSSLAQNTVRPRYLDSFASSKVGKFPRLWRTWPFQRGKAAKVYKIGEENGERFIRAYDDHDASQQIFLNFPWNIKERPSLSWSWRATTLPEGGKESNDASNDSACGVYVVVGKFDGHAIKYVWSTTLPIGQVVTRRDGKLKIKVVDSGAAKKGTWVHHKVNVVDDYKALFEKDLTKNPSGVALLTDGNALHKPSGCDYRAFAISN